MSAPSGKLTEPSSLVIPVIINTIVLCLETRNFVSHYKAIRFHLERTTRYLSHSKL